MRSNSEPSSPGTIAIFGFGPVGLAAAIEACKHDSQHRKVVVFTNREEFTRKEVIKIEEEDSDYIKELVGTDRHNTMSARWDVWFDYDRMRHHRVIYLQTRGIEDALHEELEDLKKQGRVEVIHVDQLPQIDKQNKQVELPDGRQIDFDILIEADGARHELASRLSNPQDLPVSYYPAQQQEMPVKHGVVIFKLPKGRLSEAFNFRRDFFSNKHKEAIIALDRIPTVIDPAQMTKLREFGWQHASLPEVRIFPSNGTLYVAGECPINLADDYDTRERWFRTVLRDYVIPEGIELLTVDKDYKGRPYNHGFDVVLDEAVDAVNPLPKRLVKDEEQSRPAYYVIFGDALRKAHYLTGSGALSGLRQVKAFGKFLQTRQSKHDWEALNHRIHELKDENRQRIDGYFAMRAQREEAAKAQAVASQAQGELEKSRPGKRRRRKKKKNTQANQRVDWRDHAAVQMDQKHLANAFRGKSIGEFEDVNHAFATVGLEPGPFYVCDALEARSRFDKQIDQTINNHKLDESLDHRISLGVIREHLSARSKKAISPTIPDFTTRIYGDNGLLLPEYQQASPEVVKYRLAYAVRAGGDNKATVKGEKTYHFYNFDIHRQRQQKLRIEKIRYCQFIILEDGRCQLRLPAQTENLAIQVRMRMGLPVEVPGHAELFAGSEQQNVMREKMDRSTLRRRFASAFQLDQRSRYYPKDKSLDIIFDLSESEIDGVLGKIHGMYCTNNAVTKEQFITTMRRKIDKRKNGNDHDAPQVEALATNLRPAVVNTPNVAVRRKELSDEDFLAVQRPTKKIVGNSSSFFYRAAETASRVRNGLNVYPQNFSDTGTMNEEEQSAYRFIV